MNFSLKAIAFTGFICLLFSCSHENPPQPSDESQKPEIKVSEIPLEDALTSLQEFMSDAYPEKLTKAGSFEDMIESIAVHHSKTSLTKVGSPTADAYIVNFVDDGGFAVLGAKSDLEDIIAVTERGSITPEEIDSAYKDLTDQEEVLFYDEEGKAYTSYYCEEDDDYYSGGTFSLPVLIYNDLNTDGSGRAGSSGPGGGSSTSYYTTAPLLKTRWSQGGYHESGVYNKYCKVAGKNMCAGCSTTALAQIVAYNQFPSRIGGKDMNYEEMTKIPNARLLDEYSAELVSHLYGDIFNHVCKGAGKDGTLISPEQIKNRMKQYGYSNVFKLPLSKLNDKVLQTISYMLQKSNPVFFSAVACVIQGHSWVIDGAKYTPYGNYLLHFNFGWAGDCNGYFSPYCLNPVKAYEYDSNSAPDDSYYDDQYSWHFRMIIYD